MINSSILTFISLINLLNAIPAKNTLQRNTLQSLQEAKQTLYKTQIESLKNQNLIKIVNIRTGEYYTEIIPNYFSQKIAKIWEEQANEWFNINKGFDLKNVNEDEKVVIKSIEDMSIIMKHISILQDQMQEYTWLEDSDLKRIKISPMQESSAKINELLYAYKTVYNEILDSDLLKIVDEIEHFLRKELSKEIRDYFLYKIASNLMDDVKKSIWSWYEQSRMPFFAEIILIIIVLYLIYLICKMIFSIMFDIFSIFGILYRICKYFFNFKQK